MEVMKDENDKSWGFWLLALQIVCFITIVLIGFLAIPDNKLKRTVALLLFLAQFPVYQTAIAFLYPYECTFSKVYETIDYTGNEIRNIDNRSAGHHVSGEHILMQCGMNPCAWFGLKGIVSGVCGEQGGREWYASLSHVTALALLWALRKAFILNYPDVRGKISDFDITLIYINIVDIQDFFILFLEDDVIRNFWGRDMCDNPSYGCSGRGFVLWWFILFSLWTSYIALGFTLGNYIKHLISQPIEEEPGSQSQPLPRPASATSGVDSDEEENASECCICMQSLYLSPQGKALMFLFCIDLPFLVARTLCSMRYSVLSTSLSIKNIVFMCGELMVARALIASRKREYEHPENVKQAFEEAFTDLRSVLQYISPDDSPNAGEAAASSRSPLMDEEDPPAQASRTH
jgi:hypothetical protein